MMKYSVVGVLIIALGIASCQPQQTEPRSNGYVNVDDPNVQGKQWKMGTQEAVDFADQVIADYNAGNVEALMSVVADTATFHFADGTVASGKENIRKGLTDYLNSFESHEWTTEVVFSVDLDLDQGGEWVIIDGNETVTPKEGDPTTANFLEAWYVVGDKIVTLYQYQRKLPSESGNADEEQ